MKTAFTGLLLICTFFCNAQTYPVTSINISLSPTPNASTALWKSGASTLTITATAAMSNGRVLKAAETLRLLVVIKKNGTKVCGIYTPFTAPITGFTAASRVWSGVNAVNFLGEDCNLAPGNYEICARFYNQEGIQPQSNEVCKSFTIASTEQNFTAPQNLLPNDGAIFNTSMATQPVLFRWVQVTPTPQSPVTYRLKVWKLQPGQTATQAMNMNTPVVTKDVTAVNQTFVTNMIDASCLLPSSCDFVWQVQALGQGTATYGPNNGKSAPTTFGTEHSTAPPVATVDCNSLSTKAYAIGDEILLSDDFKMKLTAVPTGTNGALSGTGTVKVKWLGTFNVKFNNIKVNAQDKLCAGAVYTNSDPDIVYPIQFAVNVTNATTVGQWTTDKVKAVAHWIKSKANIKPLVAATDEVDQMLTTVPLDMPVGYFKDGDTTTAIGFTEMVFRPDYAEFEVIASLTTSEMFKKTSHPLYGTNAIALQGSGIHFKNSGLKSINGAIKLLEPIVASYSNNGTENLKLTFNKEESGHIGNGVVFSETNNDFWRYNLDVSTDLPKEWVTPVDPTKTNVTINFQAEISQWHDFLVEGTLPECTITNSNGIGVKAGLIAYDHSYTVNPTNIVFPAGYAGNTNSFFSGFYLKDFKFTLPDQLRSYADTTKQVEVVAQNMIIDEYGLSGSVAANNVLSYPVANVGNLGGSIDTVKVTLVNNTLTEAKMLGKITLPMSSTSNVADAINYVALFTPGNTSNAQTSSLVFTLKPANDITSKFLGDGKVQIDNSSNLSLTLTKVNKKREVAFNFDLNGKIYYPTGKIIDPGSSIPLDLDLSCRFEHLGMSYSKAATESFSFDPGNWSFASPQKKLSGFSFTITDVHPKIDPVGAGTEKQYVFKGGVELVAKINIGSENSNVAISGDTKIALTGAIESDQYVATANASGGNIPNMNQLTSQLQTPSNLDPMHPGGTVNAVKADYGFLTQLKPKYLGIEVKSIGIDVTTAAVKLKGHVDFFKRDNQYGNGFRGTIEAKFTTIEMAVQAGAIFGNTKYIPGNNGNGFKYWMVEAQATIPPPGIVFMTGVAFRGFGAGVYSRMNMTPPAVFNPTTAAASTFGGAVFTPDQSVKIGFKVKGIIATTPKEETLNGSVALGAEFNASGGMNFIQFNGLFNCGAKIGQENKAFANGAIDVKYDFPNKIFSMNSLLNINKDPITTPSPIGTSLYVNSKQNRWYFKSGTPTAPMVVRINSTNFQSYLMFGNDIGSDIPKGFMKETRDGFAGIGYSLPNFNETATGDNKYQSGKGFAFGLGVNFSKSDSYSFVSWQGSTCNCRRYIDLNYSVAAGGEIDASLLQYANCAGFGDGWRAKMSVAVYAGATINYSYSLPVVGSGSGQLGRATGAAYATAEFPNPTYIKGKVDGDFSLAGYSIGFHKEFVTGSQCSGTELTPEASVTPYQQENVADSLDYALIRNIMSPGTSNVARNTEFAVLLNYPYNESFDLEEQQSSGQINTRTFRVTYTISLKQDSLSSTGGTGMQQAAMNGQLAVMNGVNTQATPASNVVNLVDGGVDALGARLFRLQRVNFVPVPLKANTSYHFRISAKLEEKVNNNWVAVKKKGTNQNITQVEDLWFKTNSDAVNTNVTLTQPPAIHR